MGSEGRKNLQRDAGGGAVVPSDAGPENRAPGLNGPGGSPTHRRLEVAEKFVVLAMRLNETGAHIVRELAAARNPGT
jgi:hypothetical protein